MASRPLLALVAPLALALATAPLLAQGATGSPGVPATQWPPSGTCRLWIDGVAATRQPPATDCATAERQADYGVHVLYGANARSARNYRNAGRRVATTDASGQSGWSNSGSGYNDQGGSSGGYGSDAPGDGMCYDRNRDGRCDDANSSTNYPGSSGGYNGRAADGYPSAAPEMGDALQFRDGIRTDALSRWVGQEAVRVAVADANRDGRYESAIFLGQDGRAVQSWADANGDGRIEQIRLYQNGQVARTLSR